MGTVQNDLLAGNAAQASKDHNAEATAVGSALTAAQQLGAALNNVGGPPAGSCSGVPSGSGSGEYSLEGPYLATCLIQPMINTLSAYQSYLQTAAPLVAGASSPPPPTQSSSSGTWQGQSVTLTAQANQNVEALPDAAWAGQVTNFQTSDAAYTCLNGQSLNVWIAPSEFPGAYVVHNGNQGSQCAYGTWTFPGPGTWYTATWLVPLGNVPAGGVSLTHVANFTSDSAGLIGVVTNFQTNDPNYTCFNGSTLSVYQNQPQYPGAYVVHAYNAGCSPRQAGTWLLP